MQLTSDLYNAHMIPLDDVRKEVRLIMGRMIDVVEFRNKKDIATGPLQIQQRTH